MSESSEFKALTEALAGRKVPQDMVKKMADDLSKLKGIKRIDVCKYGICIDKFIEGSEWWKDIENLKLMPDAQLREIKIFPGGLSNQIYPM